MTFASRCWRLSTTLVVTAVALLVAGLALSRPASAAPSPQIPSPAAPDHTEAISRAVAYLGARQLPDGSLPGFYGTGDEFTTLKGVLALAAAGYPQHTLAASPTQATLLDFLAARAVTYTHDVSATLLPARAGMLAVGVVAGDMDPHAFGGMDVVAELAATFHPATGAYSTTAQTPLASGAATAYGQAWAILGLAAAQAPVPAPAVDFLLELQELDGGWGYGFGGDVDTTALALQALLASGHVPPGATEVLAAQAFLRAQQDAAGSWGFTWGGTYYPSADSTAATLQALVALGYTPATHTWRAANGDPHSALAAMQAPDGSFSGNALGTAHAVAGLAEAPLPLFGRMQRARLALTYLHDLQGADGRWPALFGHPAGPTADAVLAFAAAGYDPHTVRASGSVSSAMDYLAATASDYAALSPDAAGKLALAVVAAGDDPASFGDVDLVDVVNGYYSPTVGAFAGDPGNTWHQALPILGLRAAGEDVPPTATQRLRELQQADGGWKYDLNPWSPASDPDSTGLAMQALAAAGEPVGSAALVSATAYLRDQRNLDGGWGSANSTALAIQGLLAAGIDGRDPAWLVRGRDLFAVLGEAQKPDGPFTYGAFDDAFATRQAVPALVGRTLPLSPLAPGPWSPVLRGPDPDRLVVGAADYDLAAGQVVLPFGSDLDVTAVVTGVWRRTAGAWSATFTMTRGAGRFTWALPFTDTAGYELRLVARDAAGVQGATEQLYRGQADLRTSAKGVTPSEAWTGQTVTYTVALHNSGPVTATGVVMTDTLGWEVGFADWVTRNGAHVGVRDGAETITWTGEVPPATTVSIAFTARVIEQADTLQLLHEHAVSNTVRYTSQNAGAGALEAAFMLRRYKALFLPLTLRE